MRKTDGKRERLAAERERVGLFARFKYGKTQVERCRHDQVCRYVADVVQGIKQLLSKENVQKIVVAIVDGSGKFVKVHERFVFEVSEAARGGSETHAEVGGACRSRFCSTTD